MKVPSYNKDNRKENTNGFTLLPKGNYVCKIMGIELVEYKKKNENDPDRNGIKISFDIAEGEYKDFYSKKDKENEDEDKKWPMDAIYWLGIPYDGCPGFVQDTWDTFWANIEDSNNGYIFDGNEKTVKGKVFGGLFHIEQTEYNQRIYDHTRLKYTCVAQDIRDGKVTRNVKDKLIDVPATTDTSFIDVPPNAPVDLPF